MVAVSLAADPDLVKWGYRIARFTSFMNPLDDMLGTGYHLSHSLFALGHGGFTGAGFGHGVQKLHYLPYPYNDFIFAVIGEEFGFIGSLLFLVCYVPLSGGDCLLPCAVRILTEQSLDPVLSD